jgi:hypothetical protein
MPLHEPSLPAERRDPAVERWNARLGLALFAIYVSAYAAFVYGCVNYASSFAAVPAGLALIVGAMAVAFLYAGLSRAPKGPA